MCQQCVQSTVKTLNGKKSIPCTDCKGTGKLNRGRILKCYSCAGKGTRTYSDIIRTESYYAHRVTVCR